MKLRERSETQHLQHLKRKAVSATSADAWRLNRRLECHFSTKANTMQAPQRRRSCPYLLSAERSEVPMQQLSARYTHHLIKSSFLMMRPSSFVSEKSNTIKRASSLGSDFTISANASLFLSSG